MLYDVVIYPISKLQLFPHIWNSDSVFSNLRLDELSPSQAAFTKKKRKRPTVFQ